MKKLKPDIYLVFILIMSMLSIFTSCPDAKDECKKDEMPTISKSFVPSVQVKYKDGVPFDGKVEFLIYKEYCEGKQSGYFTNSGTPNSSGIYFTGMEYTYIFANKKDHVFCQFTAYHTPFYPAVEQKEVAWEDFNYDKAISDSDEYDEINKTLYITIPTNSDGTK